MLTVSESGQFRSWLRRLSSRCVLLSGQSLDDLQTRLESSGVLPEPGLMNLLCDRWRKGAAVGPSAGWLLGVVERMADELPPNEVREIQWARFILAIDRGFRSALAECNPAA